jgi:hypothetical protein
MGSPPGIESALWPAYRRHHFSKPVGSIQWLESTFFTDVRVWHWLTPRSSDVRFAPKAALGEIEI